MAALLLFLAVPVLLAVNPGTASASPFGQAVVNEAALHYGAPYVYGAVGPNTFDCSGFTGFVYRVFGVSLPRTAQQQYDAIPHVPQAQQDVGDLVFFYNGSGIYHVGIYAGGGQMWAATHTGDVVHEQPIWTSAYLVGRPVPPAGAAAPLSAIAAHWQAFGGAGGPLGIPVTGENRTPDGAGLYTHYSRAASIYWTPGTGAQAVFGAIRDTWSRLGWEAGALGYPTTDETATPNGRGRYNHFTGGGVGGSIYWTPATGAHEVLGSIRGTWAALGWEAGAVGFPTTDELPTPDRRGRFTHFDGNGAGASIYWTPTTGAHEVLGAIRGVWSRSGWEAGALGYPTTDELSTPDGVGRYTHFTGKGVGASIYWTPQAGAHAVVGSVRNAWGASGWERGPLGYPVSNEFIGPDGLRRTNFAHGFITVNPGTLVATVHLS